MSRTMIKVDIAKVTPSNALQKRRDTKSDQLKAKVNDLVSSSTLHGLPNAFRSDNYCIKLMWLILTFVFLLLCSVSIAKTINDYLDYEVITTISVINEQEAEFPTISFCRSSTINISLELSISRCLFMGDFECEKNPTNYFESFKDLLYGTCYRFNSGKSLTNSPIEILKTSVPGQLYGLILDLNVTGTNTLNELTVVIHNRSHTPSLLFNTGYQILSGSRNFFIVQRNFEYKLPDPYNPCFKDVTLSKANTTIINYILSRNRSYTQSECLSLCVNLKYVETQICNCGTLNQLEATFSICYKTVNYTIKQCTMEFFRNFQAKNVSDYCPRYCPLECDLTSYSISLYTETINQNGELNPDQTYFKNFKTLDQVKKNYFSINVYYDQLKYNQIDQSPKMEFIDLISNIGGILGVFLGVSFLSFFELFELLVETITILSLKKN